MVDFKKKSTELFTIQINGGAVSELPRKYTPYPSPAVNRVMLVNPENPSDMNYLYSDISIDGVSCVSVYDAIEKLIVVTHNAGGSGGGTVASVNMIPPDSSGNIALAAGDVNAYTKAETGSLVAGLDQKISVLQGAIIPRGTINKTTDEIKADHTLLTARIQELLTRAPQKGDSLFDMGGIDWYFNESGWLELGPSVIGSASNTSFGIIKGGVNISIINGEVESVNAATLNGKAATAFATSAQGAVADTAIQSATLGGSLVVKVGSQLQFPASDMRGGIFTNANAIATIGTGVFKSVGSSINVPTNGGFVSAGSTLFCQYDASTNRGSQTYIDVLSSIVYSRIYSGGFSEWQEENIRGILDVGDDASANYWITKKNGVYTAGINTLINQPTDSGVVHIVLGKNSVGQKEGFILWQSLAGSDSFKKIISNNVATEWIGLQSTIVGSATNTSLGIVKGGSNISIVNGEVSVIGGNADTVDGKHASDFIPYFNGDLPTTSIGDLAYYKSLINGTYVAKPGTISNQPSDWGLVFVMQGYVTDVVVLWFTLATGTTYKNQNAIGWVSIADGGNAATVSGYSSAQLVRVERIFTATPSSPQEGDILIVA